MSAHHLPIVRKLRSIARQTGLLGIAKRVLGHGAGGYEDAFSNAMLGVVSTGDTVWDIGANVGYYTTRFCEKVGDSGKVVAFEPLPAAMESLKMNLSSVDGSRYLLCHVAISDYEGTAFFENQTGGGVTTTAHLVDAGDGTGTDDETKIAVTVTSVDQVRESRDLPIPTITKIDVEGYEGEVIQGGHQVFSSDVSKHILSRCISHV